MAKSPDAFRTISEVSEWLDTPAHVLRFWESKFTQIKPVKRAGGRRYYRPEDMALLGGIKTLLHEQGMTIKGVQKLLREQGIRHVAALGPQPLDTVPAEDPDEMDLLPDETDEPPEAPEAPEDDEPEDAVAAAPDAGGQGIAGDLPDLPPPARPAPAQPAPAHTSPARPAPARPVPDGVPQAPPLARRAGPSSPVRLDPSAVLRRSLPGLPPEAAAVPGILSAILARDPADLARRADRLAPVAARLAALRDRLRATL